MLNYEKGKSSPLTSKNVTLFERLSAEYDEFYEKLLHLSQKEVLEHSYEKVFKEDIVACFEEAEMEEILTEERLKWLFSRDNALDALYQFWMDKEESYMDRLRDAITEFEI